MGCPGSAEATPATISEAPAAITAPAAIRATRTRVFFVICLLPPVAVVDVAAHGAGRARRRWLTTPGPTVASAPGTLPFPRFTCAPRIRMPRFTFPIFQSIVKAVAGAMSYGRAFAGSWLL
ncbi:hypothetical protein HEK131_07610 [Streptomyces seoulensis]|nr:hypothetical protein HEK131_07610 [Streptomyces seoulensis]